jgi:predicted metal-dependent hydrolase
MRILVYSIIVIFIISVIGLIKLQKNEVKYIKSNIDGKEYLVRDLEDKQLAADLLATLNINMMKLVNHLYENKDNKYKDYKKYIEQLKTRINNVIINESNGDSAYTSYSINKGEQIVFCLRSKQTGQLHDINLLMYVALHEMAHVGCPTYGHNDEFKKIFAFFTSIGIEIGIYSKTDFHNNPIEYCGLTISESIV